MVFYLLINLLMSRRLIMRSPAPTHPSSQLNPGPERECCLLVLNIWQFSILYTSMYSPAGAASLCHGIADIPPL